MTLLWTWKVSGHGTEASGVCGERDRAKHEVSEWMLAHSIDAGRVEQVRLAFGSGNMLTRHEPTGIALRARRGRDGRVRWACERADG